MGARRNHCASVSRLLAQYYLIFICKEFSKKDLFTRCLDGHKLKRKLLLSVRFYFLHHVPKYLNADAKIIKITTAYIFNEDYSGILKIMQLLEINVVKYSTITMSVELRGRSDAD